jgi:hypothetical protein
MIQTCHVDSESRTRRSGGVTAAAIVAILGSLLLLLCSLFGLLGVVMMQNAPGNPAAQQPELRYAGFVGVVFIAAGGVWGLASGIGLLRYRNWARISTLVWSGLAVAFCSVTMLFVSSMKFPIPPNAGQGTESFVRFFVFAIYGLPLLIGVWWLILFTRKSIVALFTSSVPGVGAVLDPSGFPSALAKPRPPLPVAIVAWFLIVSSPLSLVFLFFQRFPLLLWGHLYHGLAGAAFLLVSAVLCLAGGIGLLKLKPWGFWTIVVWQVFGLLNGTVSLLSPNYDSLMKEILATSRFAHARDYPMPVQSYRAFASLGLAFVAIVLVILLSYRTRFLAASATDSSDQS